MDMIFCVVVAFDTVHQHAYATHRSLLCAARTKQDIISCGLLCALRASLYALRASLRALRASLCALRASLCAMRASLCAMRASLCAMIFAMLCAYVRVC